MSFRIENSIRLDGNYSFSYYAADIDFIRLCNAFKVPYEYLNEYLKSEPFTKINILEEEIVESVELEI